jgi:hypothetical protein
MLPLIPLALSLAPSIATWLFGPAAAKTTAAVAALAETVTGTADPTAQLHALEDPAQASAFQLELAKLSAQLAAEQRAAELATLQAQLADLVNARGTMVTLAQAHSPIAWGAPIVSAIVLATFGAMLSVVLMHKMPDGSEALANVMLGTLAAMATSTVSYWVGSSAGSARKSADLAEANKRLANSAPIAGSDL